MKNIISFFALSVMLLSFSKTQAQDSLRVDSTLYLNGRLKIIFKESAGDKKVESFEVSSSKMEAKSKAKKREKIETHWGGFSMGFTNLMDRTDYSTFTATPPYASGSFFAQLKSAPTASDFDLRTGKSLQINFDVVKQSISLYKHHVCLIYGLNYEINNWSFKNPVSWRKANDYSVGQFSYGNGPFMTRDSVSYDKNKVVSNFIQVPLMLRFETKPTDEDKNFYLNVGVFGGYLVRSHTKQIMEGSSDKIKRFDDFILNNWQYGAMAEIGTRNISLYYKQTLSPWLQYGMKQMPYSFGVRISGF